MKKSKKKLVVAALVFFSISLLVASPAQAKAKKLKVNTVYTTAKKVTGTTLKKAKVTVKVGSKIKTVKSNSKGKFTVKIPKQKKSGKKITVRVYKTDGTQYANKTVKVKKRLSVNKVYTSSTKVKGTTKWKKKYVKVKIGNKTYGGKVTNKGQFTIKIPKQKKGTKITVGIYKKKKNGSYKKIIAISIKVKKKSTRPKESNGNAIIDKTLPTIKTAEIDEKQFLKDYEKVMKSGKEINRFGKTNYAYQILRLGNTAIGFPYEYIKTEANGSHVTLKAKNGATLYYTIGAGGSFDFEFPTLVKYDGILKSGQTKKWEGWDFKEGELPDNNLYLKIYAYKEAKLVAIVAEPNYLIQGYADWMFE